LTRTFPPRGLRHKLAAAHLLAISPISMRAIFHLMPATADITDFEFLMLAYFVSGTFEPGMLVRFRPQSRFLRTDLV
jgi:hypothetical protein